MARKTAVSFTGGKDSTLTIHLLSRPPPDDDDDLRTRLSQCAGCEVCLLVTFVPAGESPDFKAHPLNVMKLQAAAMGIEHITLEIEAPYLQSYNTNIRSLKDNYGITVLATGDMMDVSNGFMSKAVADTGVELLCPLWAMERQKVLRLVWHYEMQSLVTCVNVKKFGQDLGQDQQSAPHSDECGPALPSSALSNVITIEPMMLLGKVLTPELLQSVLLPAKVQFGVDECGELGEYHTMTCNSILFKKGLELQYENRQEKEYKYLKITSAKLQVKA